MKQAFDFESLVELCRQTHEQMQRHASRAVDASLAARNWLFGWYIVEFEQNGADRAEYGRQVIRKLAVALKSNGLRGTSTTNLKQSRSFYLAYSGIGQTASDLSSVLQIGQTVSDQFLLTQQGQLGIEQTASALSDAGIPETLSRILGIGPTASGELLPTQLGQAGILQTLSAKLSTLFRLGWSQYVALLTIDNPDERRFHEIEAAENHWTVRELERQIASSLYERLALSRDKDEIRRLAREGQVVEKAADLIKNPLVLEFLDLEEKPAYTEQELESAIIDRLETFLLELGKGFLFEARQNGGTDLAAGRQHLRLEVPAVPAVQRGTETPARTRSGRVGRGCVMSAAFERGYKSYGKGIRNPGFNYGEFAIIKSQAGLNSYKISVNRYKISVKEWVEKTL